MLVASGQTEINFFHLNPLTTALHFLKEVMSMNPRKSTKCIQHHSFTKLTEPQLQILFYRFEGVLFDTLQYKCTVFQ